MKVKSIVLDIIVGDQCDGFDLAEEVSNELNRRGFNVVGAGFNEDMTAYYEEYQPELLKDN